MRGVFYFYYMHDFLKDVTKDIFNNNVNISDCIIILPNKRSGFFLKEEINFQVSNTIFSPRIYEIDDFMSLVSGVEKISNTDIIFELYKTYCESKSRKKAENFEEFISWGKSLLVDFNEIDKVIFPKKSNFIKKKLSLNNNQNEISINDWIQEIHKEIILKIDIEGDEYITLANISDQNLKKIRILIIEFHGLRNLRSDSFLNFFEKIVSRIDKHFYSCHQRAH